MDEKKRQRYKEDRYVSNGACVCQGIVAAALLKVFDDTFGKGEVKEAFCISKE